MDCVRSLNSISALKLRGLDRCNTISKSVGSNSTNGFVELMGTSGDAPRKIVTGDAGYVLEDVPHLTDYVADLPVLSLSLSPSLYICVCVVVYCICEVELELW